MFSLNECTILQPLLLPASSFRSREVHIVELHVVHLLDLYT
jgi:hypothetical protein